jgi:hypothetical protein
MARLSTIPFAGRAHSMASTRTNARKQGQRMKLLMRQRQILKAKQTGTPVIPTRVLTRLANLNLPNDPWVYSVCLAALMRDA